jgi:N-sulfoglucosamine sulfohydrolase
MIVRDPYQTKRGFTSQAMISHVDITPTLLDYAGGLADGKPTKYGMVDLPARRAGEGVPPSINRNGGRSIDAYHGRSWLAALADPQAKHADAIYASHTFHEIQMYYPMRVIRDEQYKLIWNIAHGLPYPFASDLWAASSWQAQYKKGMDADYGVKTVKQYIHRPQFELYDMRSDPQERTNLADSPGHANVLKAYQERLKSFQKSMDDPWLIKWDYE